MSYLNYKELGEGEPVLILHGLLGMLDNWKTFARKLAEEYWVILVDQRNHGKSFHSDEFDYDLLAEDLKHLMEGLYIPKAHLLGHSMGGKTVMKFMDLYPDMVDQAVVVDISPTGSIAKHSLIFESLLGVEIGQVEDRKAVQAELESKGIEKDVVLFLMKNLKRNAKTSGYEWKANIPVLWESYDNILAATLPSVPSEKEVLFVAGGKSGYIRKEDVEIIAEAFPEYVYEVIEGAGHWVHAEKPEELLRVVTGFIGS